MIGKKVILLNKELSDIIAVGELTFLGENNKINWGLQATVSRFPCQIKSIDQVIEWSEELVRMYQYKKYE